MVVAVNLDIGTTGTSTKWTQRPSASRHSTDRSLAAARRPTTVPKTGPTLRRQYPQGLRTMCQIDLYYKCGLIGVNLRVE